MESDDKEILQRELLGIFQLLSGQPVRTPATTAAMLRIRKMTRKLEKMGDFCSKNATNE
jgi:hypothetical protein